MKKVPTRGGCESWVQQVAVCNGCGVSERQDGPTILNLGSWPGADAFNQDWEFRTKSKFTEK